jgi:hypothetical protein
MQTEKLLAKAASGVKGPLTDDTLNRFIEAHQIARTGKDFEGRKFNSLGMINQAAWAGENLHFLFAEILRLRTALKPFAELYKGRETWSDDQHVGYFPPIPWVRAAAAALSKCTHNENGVCAKCVDEGDSFVKSDCE